jgi:hypothetical protein
LQNELSRLQRSSYGLAKTSHTAGTLGELGAKICWKNLVKILTKSKNQNIIKTGGKIIMEIFYGFNFRKFKENDIKTFSTIMKQSFDKDFQMHLGEGAGVSPSYDDGDFLRKWYFLSGGCGDDAWLGGDDFQAH